jgi:hypothetical protein
VRRLDAGREAATAFRLDPRRSGRKAGTFPVKRVYHATMKILRWLLPLMLTLTGMLRAAEPIEAPQSDYARAVQTYVDGATQQLRDIRASVDAQVGSAPSDEVKKRFAMAYTKLDRSDKVLAELKKAGPADFDRIKLKFEQTRDDMIKSIELARQG